VLGDSDYAAAAEHAIFLLEPACISERARACYGLAVFELLAIQSAI